jgi:hypothetical protein
MTRIEKDFSFLASLYFHEHTVVNQYNMTLFIDVATDDEEEQLTAIERIQFLLKCYIEHSVFVCQEHKAQISLLEKAGLTVIALPDEPYDQIVGLILLRKFNAITEGRLIVTEIKFGSRLSADIRFHNDIEESEEFSEPAWYNDPALTIHNTDKKSKKDKVVKFEQLEDWNKIGLNWKS